MRILAQFRRPGEDFSNSTESGILLSEHRTPRADSPLLVRRLLPTVCWFRHRSGVFVILKDSSDLPEETLLFVGVWRIIRILAIGRLRRRHRHDWLLTAREDPGNKALKPLLRFARIMRLGSSHKSRGVIIRAVGRCEQVRGLVELYV